MKRSLRYVPALLASFVWTPSTSAQEGDAAPPVLFESDEALAITLEADFRQLRRDRDEGSPERPAVLRWTEPDGSARQQEVQLRTRGIFRLQRSTCELPNLRLNVRTAGSLGTVFQGQDKLKLVGFCRDDNRYEQNVLEELLAYRLYGLFTDYSFRTRLLRITYVDTSGEHDPITRYGFAIEAEEALAMRLGAVLIQVAQAHPHAIPGTHAARQALFQYMIGNTDFSVVTLHNSRLVRLGDGQHLTIPYDFDSSGLVNAPYARPHPELGIRRVRERLYRGFCRPEVDFRALFAEFLAKREAVYELISEQEGLRENERASARDYIADFYEAIENEGRALRMVERDCRAMPRD